MRRSNQFCLSLTLGLLFACHISTLTAAPAAPQPRSPAAAQVSAAYENTTITEDVTWRGTVIVRGALVVAPQATLRIEPGTVVRFTAPAGSRQLPRLVVMGRIQSVGTLERPIIFTHGLTDPVAGGWGGILLLNSEKRNQIEHCRIEGAGTALEARFSSFSARSLIVPAASTGLLLYDCTASVTFSVFSGCQTGVEAHDSELELRESTAAQNRRGLDLFRSSVVLSAVTMTGNRQAGLLAEECRLKISACEMSANGIGAQITGGEGQLTLSRFLRNLETALHVSDSRLKISNCRFSDNLRDGLKLDDGRATLWGNIFSGNGNYNLVNAGTEDVTAVQNWWGAVDEPSIQSKIMDVVRDRRFGAVHLFPWLTQRPMTIP